MRGARGFTLVELLVAVALLAVLAALSFRGLGAILDTESHVRADTQRWNGVARVMDQLAHDIAYASARPEIGAGGELMIARLGEAEGAAAPQRVGYRLRDGALEYRVQASASAVLEQVAGFEIRALGADGAWTPLAPLQGPQALPRALQVQLVLAGGERVSRIFLLR